MAGWFQHWGQNRGSTLIEVLAGMAIFALLTTVGLVSVIGTTHRQDVAATARRISDDLRWIQQRALADGAAWKLSTVQGAPSYTLSRADTCDGTGMATWTVWSGGRQISASVVVTTQDVIFTCRGRRDMSIDASVQAVTVTTVDGTYLRTVKVQPLGRISLE